MADKKPNPYASEKAYMSEFAVPTADVEGALGKIDDIFGQKHTEKLITDLYRPAAQAFHAEVSGLIQELGGKDQDAAISDDHHTALKYEIAAKARAYMDKVLGVKKPTEGLSEDDQKDWRKVDEYFRTVMAHFDQYHGANINKGEGLGNQIEAALQEGEASYRELDILVWQTSINYVGQGAEALKQKALTVHLSNIHGPELARHLEDNVIPTSHMKVGDPFKFRTLGKGELFQIYQAAKDPSKGQTVTNGKEALPSIKPFGLEYVVQDATKKVA